MAEKDSPSWVRRAAGWVAGTAKKAIVEAVDAAFFGRVGAQGAAEVANALFAGTGYVPYGAGQQPGPTEPGGEPLIHGSVVPESSPQAQADALAVGPPANLTDPLQRAAANAQAAQARGQARELEIA